ncbi:hypothetical protein [Deinococcus hopiensis]|uniref:hypothetical protein n=1 Tax=Deinococcus hopiensis TaxID=309885 RepID=UPI00111BE6F8|nr:hypothetical protein [Deinococcus hopiensis]
MDAHEEAQARAWKARCNVLELEGHNIRDTEYWLDVEFVEPCPEGGVAGRLHQDEICMPSCPAVVAAYGWEWPLSEDEVLARLQAINLERADQPLAAT